MPTLLELPADVLIHLLKRLDAVSIAACIQTSKTFKIVVCENEEEIYQAVAESSGYTNVQHGCSATGSIKPQRPTSSTTLEKAILIQVCTRESYAQVTTWKEFVKKRQSIDRNWRDLKVGSLKWRIVTENDLFQFKRRLKVDNEAQDVKLMQYWEPRIHLIRSAGQTLMTPEMQSVPAFRFNTTMLATITNNPPEIRLMDMLSRQVLSTIPLTHKYFEFPTCVDVDEKHIYSRNVRGIHIFDWYIGERIQLLNLPPRMFLPSDQPKIIKDGRHIIVRHDHCIILACWPSESPPWSCREDVPIALLHFPNCWMTDVRIANGRCAILAEIASPKFLGGIPIYGLIAFQLPIFSSLSELDNQSPKCQVFDKLPPGSSFRITSLNGDHVGVINNAPPLPSPRFMVDMFEPYAAEMFRDVKWKTLEGQEMCPNFRIEDPGRKIIELWPKGKMHNRVTYDFGRDDELDLD